MAIESQIAILRKGVQAWNDWRVKNRDSVTDLNLTRIDLHGAKLHGIDFEDVNLYATDLGRADLSNANLQGAHLRKCFLSGVNLSNSNLRKADLRYANLKEAKIIGADLSYARLGRAKLEYSTLIRSHLDNASFSGAYLADADLRDCSLKDTDFFHADLRNSILIGADFRGANLRGAYLGGTSLKDAELSKTRLDEADLGWATLGSTILCKVDLSRTKRLETVHHLSESSLGIDTMRLSKGKIPEIFLRGCGLSDAEIEHSKLAEPGLDPEQITDITYKIHQIYLGGGIQYYSCFISYNNKDEEFAKQLHDDLQNNGVRCWFAPEDMKIGDQIRPRIDQEIRLRDKLLVILSENSVKSEWVGDEVEAALEEESKSNRLVLFPIRLDDAVISTRDDWAAKIKRRRHIGDFSNWKDKASYQKAFERLLRDLKATGGEVNGE